MKKTIKENYQSPEFVAFEIVSNENILNSVSIQTVADDIADGGDADFGKNPDGTYIDWTSNNF